MIKNILFDLDDTILDFHIAEREALKKTLVHFGIDVNNDILSRYSEINLSQWKLLEKGEITRNQVKTRRYEILFEEFGITGCNICDVTAFYEQALGEGDYCIYGAKEVLQNLFGRYRLFIVSNGNAKIQKKRIEKADIEKYFEKIFCSENMGVEKPNIEFFEKCFSQIGNCKKKETIIIGDSISSDIQGGINAGIKTVYFDPNGKCNNSDISADFVIEKLSQIDDVLKKLQ